MTYEKERKSRFDCGMCMDCNIGKYLAVCLIPGANRAGFYSVCSSIALYTSLYDGENYHRRFG